MKQAKIISIANHKGGVGKTTTTASVGSILATKGYKVLSCHRPRCTGKLDKFTH